MLRETAKFIFFNENTSINTNAIQLYMNVFLIYYLDWNVLDVLHLACE